MGRKSKAKNVNPLFKGMKGKQQIVRVVFVDEMPPEVRKEITPGASLVACVEGTQLVTMCRNAVELMQAIHTIVGTSGKPVKLNILSEAKDRVDAFIAEIKAVSAMAGVSCNTIQ